MENINWNDYEFKKMEVRKGIPIYLNVYSISPVNYFFQTLGLGIFHTGVEVQEKEYSFGSTDRDYSGVIAIRPGSLGFALKEKIYLGNTLLTPDEIRYLAYLISFIWRGLSYDPFSKNCNFFTKFFAECLLKSSVSFPNYINRFTKFRTLFQCFYKPFKFLVGDIVQMKSETTSKKEQEKAVKPSEQVSSEKKCEIVSDTITESSHDDTSKEDLKKKKKRKTQRSKISRRIKRYRIKDVNNIDDIHLIINKEKLHNQSHETHLLTSKTKVMNHNDFFKNFNQNIFSKFESNLLSEMIPLKTTPRLFLDENDQISYLKELQYLSDLTINRNIYEKIEDIVISINRKAQEKSFSLQKRKLFFLNSLAKYMKIAMKLCCVGKKRFKIRKEL
jgi:hypothetical protein